MTDSEDPLTDALVQVSFNVMALLTRIGSANDLSLTQLRVLAILRDREPKMAALADYLGLDRSTISGLIDRAVKRGLVERVSDPEDKRSTRVRLTEAGHALGARLTPEASGAVGALLSGLTEAERRTLRDLLERTLSVPEAD